jgi:putative peptide zinc metalloprotease protein
MHVLSQDASHPVVAPVPAVPHGPRLLEGTEILGPVAGSGLREPPWLVRRPDGEMVQLSRLLCVIARHLDGRPLPAVATSAGEELNLRIAPEQIRHAADARLHPLGLVVRSDGTMPQLTRKDPVLALRHRVGIVPERAVVATATVLRPLFFPPVVFAALMSLVAFDAWLVTSHGLDGALRETINRPALGLALLGLVVASLAFHEFGHAAACLYGGARPGRIGIGLYLIWPVFYTDVTDSYRLGRAGRLRTDLGGMYFNALVALGAAGLFLATGYEPLLLAVVAQQTLLLDQLVPWVRLDGYHVVSDLIGVPELFARIRPILLGLVPGRGPDPRVAELRPWARAAVTAWVLSTVVVLSAVLAVIVTHAPRYLRRAWDSLLAQAAATSHGGVLDVLTGAVGFVTLLLPLAGMLLTYLLLCRRLGATVALRLARRSAMRPGP